MLLLQQILTKILYGKADLSMALNGALAGLVSITAEPLAPSAELATVIGIIGGVIVVFSIVALDKMKIDDPVGAISVHGVAGIWGLFAVLLSNSDATMGAQLLRDSQYLCVYVHCISCNLVHSESSHWYQSI